MDQETKICTGCKQELPIDSFGIQVRRGGMERLARCKACKAEQYKDWASRNKKHLQSYYLKNKEQFRKNDENYKNRHKVLLKIMSKMLYKANPEPYKERWRNWAIRKGKDYHYVRAAEYRALKCQAIPGWYDEVLVEQIYSEARKLSNQTGQQYHVDHIVPLNHPLVCGLHVHNNLQIITATENFSKRNLFWPDMPNG